ncbi:MAG: hypothetical protein WC869_08230 [Phycisphaerae bacterium]|jgi:hypothetical protein
MSIRIRISTFVDDAEGNRKQAFRTVDAYRRYEWEGITFYLHHTVARFDRDDVPVYTPGWTVTHGLSGMQVCVDSTQKHGEGKHTATGYGTWHKAKQLLDNAGKAKLLDICARPIREQGIANPEPE